MTDDLPPRLLGRRRGRARRGRRSRCRSAHSWSRCTSRPSAEIANGSNSCVLRVSRRAAVQLVQAQVVAAALEDRERRLAAEQRRQRLGQPRQVAVDELALQRDRRGGDDDRACRVRDGVPDRGHEVGQRLAGAGARLHGEVLAGVDRLADGLGHLDLPSRRCAADGGDRGVEQLGDAGQLRGRRWPSARSGSGGTRPAPRAGYAGAVRRTRAERCELRLIHGRTTGPRRCRARLAIIGRVTCHGRTSRARARLAVPGSDRARGPLQRPRPEPAHRPRHARALVRGRPGAARARARWAPTSPTGAEGLVRLRVVAVRVDVLAPLRMAGRYRIGIGVSRIGTLVVELPLRGVRGRRVRGDRHERPACTWATTARPHRCPTSCARSSGRRRIGGSGARRRPSANRRAAREAYPFRFDVRTRFGDLDTNRHVNNVALAGGTSTAWPSCTSTCSATRSAARWTGCRRARCACSTSAGALPGHLPAAGGVLDIGDDDIVRYVCGLFDGPRASGWRRRWARATRRAPTASRWTWPRRWSRSACRG